MENVIHLRCDHCGEPLRDRGSAFCPPCSLHLAYRAMPFLMGMILTGRLAVDLADAHPDGLPGIEDELPGYEDEAVLIWE